MMKDTRGGVMTQRRRLLAGAGLAAAVPGRLLAAGAPDTLDPGASGVWDVIVAGSGVMWSPILGQRIGDHLYGT